MIFNFKTKKDIESLSRELEVGMENLTIAENMQAKTFDITLKANEIYTLSHGLKKKPKDYIIGRETGNGKVVSTSRPWDNQSIELKNLGPDSNTVRVTVFL